jgi:hypothetical protein
MPVSSVPIDCACLPNRLDGVAPPAATQMRWLLETFAAKAKCCPCSAEGAASPQPVGKLCHGASV